MNAINQILKSKGMYIQVSLENNNIHISGIKELQKVFIFSRLSEDFIIRGKNIICEIDENKFKKYEDFWVVGN